MKAQLTKRLILFIALLSVQVVYAAMPKLTVVTSTQVTYSLASELTKGTSIQVINVPERGRNLNAQPDYFRRDQDKLVETFEKAGAVIIIGKLWADDALYTAVRQHNIRVVPIDATQPWSATLPGIAVVSQPSTIAPWQRGETNVDSNQSSIYFWHSLSNAIRSADIIADDLKALVPEDATKIQANLLALGARLRELKNQYEGQFAEVANINVFLLADEFVYLTNEMGLFVEGYFVKQDIDWQQSDYQNLTNYLKENEINVVIHKWEPAEAIRKAIAAAGARLVILDTIDPGLVADKKLQPEGYFTLMESNLDLLYKALRQ